MQSGNALLVCKSMVRFSGNSSPPSRNMADIQKDLYEVLGLARDATEVQARGTNVERFEADAIVQAA